MAGYIFKESLRRERLPAIGMPEALKADEDDFTCLEECLGKLPATDHNLVLTYYREDKQAKIDQRKELAQQLGTGMNALRIRACRIRAVLQDCVERCRTALK